MLLALLSPSAMAVTFDVGDVVVSTQTTTSDVFGNPIRTDTLITVYNRSGVLKGEILRSQNDLYFDIFFRDGSIYAASLDSIVRISATGTRTRFSTGQAVFLSPGPAGGVLSIRTSDFFQFSQDGSLIRQMNDPLFGHGIDLAADRCTVFTTTGSSLANFNVCVGTTPVIFGPDHPGVFDLIRLLPDGTFLVESATGGSVLRLDATGNLIRDYGMRGNGLALDIDRTSFWTVVNGCLRRVDIATGTILSQSCSVVPLSTVFLAVVGEPRAGLLAAASGADIPAVPPFGLALLVLAIAAVAVVRFH